MQLIEKKPKGTKTDSMDNGKSLSISHALNKFHQHGYRRNFFFKNGELVCSETGKSYGPQRLLIVEKYRTEGESDPDEMAVVYGLEADDGVKGTVTDAFGTYSDPKLGDFLSHVTDIGEDQEQIEHLS